MMDADPNPTKSKPPAFSTRALHVFVLLCLAFAARLYDVLGRQPQFFVARRSEAVDVVLFVLTLSLLLPGLVVLAEWLAGLASRRVGRGCHAAVVFLSAAAIAVAALRRIEGLPGWPAVLLALSLGLLGAVAYFRFAAARALVTILGPAVVLFPGLFLFASPVFRLLSGAADPPALAVPVGKPAPVVILVFDEFCGTSLMDRRRRIDPIRYPFFAALAQRATWFRNATTISPSTHHALPALVTGRYPKAGSCLPVAAEYPRNLFTLLGNSHELVAWEAETRLCPERLAGRDSAAAGLLKRLASLLIDSAVLELHLLFPEDAPIALPDVTGRWGNFLGQDRRLAARPDPYARRREQFEEFLLRIGPSAKPGLYFAHVMLPHVPWTYLPSGKEYSLPLPPGKAGNPNVTHGVIGLQRLVEQWADDELAAAQAQQRYLLQVRFVDRLIGALVDRLRQVGLYDRSLIVITADHGVSFRPNDQRRGISDTNYPDIMSIPLLIKAPNQREAAISDRNAQSTDVLPTIAEVLQVELPWTPQGASLRDPSRPECPEKEIAPDEESNDRLAFDAAFPQKYETLGRMLARFGSGGKPDGLFRIGPHGELVGHRPEEFDTAAASGCRIELVHPEYFADVDLDGRWLPCYIGGRVRPAPETPLPVELAIAVNGTIRAVTRTFLIAGLEETWAAMVPEEAFRPGRNEVRVLVVSSAGNRVVLNPTTLANVPADE